MRLMSGNHSPPGPTSPAPCVQLEPPPHSLTSSMVTSESITFLGTAELSKKLYSRKSMSGPAS